VARRRVACAARGARGCDAHGMHMSPWARRVSGGGVSISGRGWSRMQQGVEVELLDMVGTAGGEGEEREHGMAGMPLAWPWLGHVLPFPRVSVVG
jgi:hypothetical protein